RLTSQTIPRTISSNPPSISNASIQDPSIQRHAPYRSGLVDLEVATRGGDGLGLIRLPGGNRNVCDAAPLAPHLAGSEGVTIETGTKIIYREVDDFRQMWR